MERAAGARFALLMLTACVAASCATTSSAEEASTEPELQEPEIQEVEIADKTDAAASDLSDGLANHPPSGVPFFKSRARLDRLALDVDRLRIESYYHSIGFFEAQVAEAKVRPGDDGRVIVHFDVDEGAPAIVADVVFEGLTSTVGVSKAELDELTEIDVGERFDYGTYVADKEKIRLRLYALGYASAVVKGAVEVAKKTERVRVRFILIPGPKAKFGGTEIEKTTKIPEESIQARVPWEKGQPFDPLVLKTMDRRMSELSLVGSVRYELATEVDPAMPDVRVLVTDATPHEVRLGFGAGVDTTQYELHLRAGYVQRDFFDPLLTFRADVKPKLGILRDNKKLTKTVTALGELQRDDLFTPRLRGILGGAISVDQYEIYSTVTPSTYVSLDRPLFDDAFHVSTRARFQVATIGADTLSCEQKDAAGIRSPEVLFTLENAGTLDLRDDVLSPKRGGFFDLKLELGRLVTDPGGTYAKITPEARGYLPLGTTRIVLAARARGGAFFPSSGFVPITQRYFGGGAESQRGFGRRQLSPAIVDSNMVRGPIGGAALFDSSIELRLDLFKLGGNWFGLVGFFDAGDVEATLSDLDLFHLYYAAGPGLRYRTPVGPLRLDLGFRLNRMGAKDIPVGSLPFAIQFSLGEAF